MVNLEGASPLMWASMEGSFEIVSLLLKRFDTAPDMVDQDDLTALSFGAWFGHTDVVLLLLQHGAKVTPGDHSRAARGR